MVTGDILLKVVLDFTVQPTVKKTIQQKYGHMSTNTNKYKQTNLNIC